jgi:hypothetical protein
MSMALDTAEMKMIPEHGNNLADFIVSEFATAE